MEVGAFLVGLIVIGVVIVGGGIWLTASILRRRKLNSEEDKIDSQLLGEGIGMPDSPNGAGTCPSQAPNGEEQRPRHRRVANEQHSSPMPRQ